MFFNTHRVFRHYIWALVVPMLYSAYYLRYKYYTHIETLYTIHANRLNQQILSDPEYTYYPKDLEQSRKGIYLGQYY